MYRYVLAAGALLLAIVLGATVLSDPIATAAQTVGAEITGPLDGQGNVKVHEQGTASVSVANAQLAVHEQGTVPASQSGAWHVSVDGSPTVTSGDQTTTVDDFVGSVPGGGAFTQAVFAHVSDYRSVRLLTNCFSGAACANIAVQVYAVVNGRSYLLDNFQLQSFSPQTQVFDVPGPDFAVELQNTNPGAVPNVGVAVVGRRN